MKNPTIFKNFLPKEEFLKLQEYVKNLEKKHLGFSKEFNRYEFGGDFLLNEIHEKLIDTAKTFFESDTLKPSFNFGAWYFNNASLEKHKDVSPCTYSIDLCVYQKTPWPLYIDGIPYILEENDAVLYYGESQIHWREEFPDPENNVVCNLFFFYAEPDHWFFTEPEEKHMEIRYRNAKERNG